MCDLREATRQSHHALEHELDLVERVSTPSGRREIVLRFYGLHAGVERALGPLLSTVEGLDFAARRRAPLLASDLVELGMDPARATLCALSPAASGAEALGLFYVLEGSSLGGAVIRRTLAARNEDMRGLSFLHPYGEQTGARWRSFMAVVEACGGATPDARAAIVRGGERGFDLARTWLCETAAAA